jgi:hypothetical protein
MGNLVSCWCTGMSFLAIGRFASFLPFFLLIFGVEENTLLNTGIEMHAVEWSRARLVPVPVPVCAVGELLAGPGNSGCEAAGPADPNLCLPHVSKEEKNQNRVALRPLNTGVHVTGPRRRTVTPRRARRMAKVPTEPRILYGLL